MRLSAPGIAMDSGNRFSSHVGSGSHLIHFGLTALPL
jgi:hypothetical protein